MVLGRAMRLDGGKPAFHSHGFRDHSPTQVRQFGFLVRLGKECVVIRETRCDEKHTTLPSLVASDSHMATAEFSIWT